MTTIVNMTEVDQLKNLLVVSYCIENGQNVVLNIYKFGHYIIIIIIIRYFNLLIPLKNIAKLGDDIWWENFTLNSGFCCCPQLSFVMLPSYAFRKIQGRYYYIHMHMCVTLPLSEFLTACPRWIYRLWHHKDDLPFFLHLTDFCIIDNIFKTFFLNNFFMMVVIWKYLNLQ